MIFKYIEEDCKKIKEMGDFVIQYERVLSKLTNFNKFKREVEKLYLDCKLLDNLRAQCTRYHQDKHFNTPLYKNPNQERCQASFPFCFIARGEQFANDSNLIIREQDPLSNLVLNYFNPF